MQREHLLDNLETEGRQELDLYASYLDGQLNRYALLPALLSNEQRLQDLLVYPDQRSLLDRANLFLKEVTEITGASDVYLMNKRGTTVAASNHDDVVSFVGRNFAFRPYFTQAMLGDSGRYYALGTTSGKRGYYFSHSIKVEGRTVGVVVVKINIETFEDNWRSGSSDLVVTDPDGVIFITTRREWRYQTLRMFSNATLDRIRESRRYPNASLDPVALNQLEPRHSGNLLYESRNLPRTQYLRLTLDRPEADWQVHLFINLNTIKGQVWLTRLLLIAVILLIAMSIWTMRQRRLRKEERELERRKTMQDALQLLEERVDQRTEDLTEANKRLSDEIEKHEQTREELIQAAKLAALGQMSAGINHELNQPLAAMRTYADNARAYLEKEKTKEADWNLQQIIELTERMAQISSQLKIFSRKSSGQRVRVSVSACIQGALKVTQPKMKQCNAELVIELPDEDLFVKADMVQLEQVFVNLIGNACDATSEKQQPIIQVIGKDLGNGIKISVKDNGSGIPTEDIDHVFDPFFTTNESGLGLGLSISHTIVERLKGQLTARNHTDGGAVFEVMLEPAGLSSVSSNNDR